MKTSLRIIVFGLLFAALALAQATYKTFTIANGASLSVAVDMQSCTPMRIETPAAWTAANLTVQVSTDGVNYMVLYDEFGSLVTVTMPTAALTASISIRLNPADWWSMRYLKLQSGTPSTPVNQGAARTLKIVCR